MVWAPKMAVKAPSSRKMPCSVICPMSAARTATAKDSGWSMPRSQGTAIGAIAIGTITAAARRHVLGMKIA